MIVGHRMRRVLFAGSLVALALSFMSMAVLQYMRSRAARLGEARAVAALRLGKRGRESIDGIAA